MEIPLSNRDIQYMLPTANIIQYKNLMKYKDIDDVFGAKDNIILFLNQEGPLGHWVTLHKKNGIISYFDSYGLPPDSFPITPKLKKLGITSPHLTKLLYLSPYKIEYFPYRMQGKKTVTCGRWALLSIALNNLSDEAFYLLFQDKKASPDIIATCLTMSS